ncbi:type VII secretion-associated protein [Corynebacterium ulcerans]|uniref:type VII secretion-associated protein n=1 Tax=Corynebacterium silvaticum TaxID=2320431 RepID=UPI00148EF76E|nr:type VII secretion-associated protein [Corynebacterium silvaticum]NON70496.1 type VII secretion-associated protein [Corynebacterium silvaticum]
MNKPYDLVITVLDTATVFEGTEDAFRYDLTSAGIVEGWALDKIIEQAAEQLLPQWPAVTIHIIAETTVKEILTEQLLEHGVSVEAASAREVSYTKTEPTKSDHSERAWEPQPDNEVRDVRRKAIRAKTSSFSRIALAEKLHPFHGLLVVLVIAMAGVSWWAMGKGLTTPSIGVAPVQSVGDQELRNAPDAHSEARPAPTTSVAASLNNDVVLHHARIQVLLPSSYHLAEKEGTSGMVIATGDDPELRILLSIDPVGSTDVEAVYAELDAMITHDPTLTNGQTLGITKPTRLVSYEERPGDGSYAHWWSWVDNGHVYSVGCHSKRMSSTIPQRAVCRKAVESVSVRSS